MLDFESEKEKDVNAATEPIGGVGELTQNDEDYDVDGINKEYLENTTHATPSTISSHDRDRIEKEKRPNLEQAQSYATNTSAVTRSDSHVSTPYKKKPWYKKLNPLKWGAPPPVPETRKVSREYSASFLSLVYFQWVAPIMHVSHPDLPQCPVLISVGWIQEAARTERHMASQPRSNCGSNDSQTTSIF